MADPRPDITLILPAFNEARTIAGTVRESAAYFRSRNLRYEIVVAADGQDGTREICRDVALTEPGLRVIGEPARRGKGRGVREAVAVSTGNIIGYADADNKVPIDEYDKVAPWTGKFDAVIGSRALERKLIEKHQPLYRRVGSVGFRYFMQGVTGLRGISDTQCGFKFFQRDVARDLFSLQRVDGYMFDVEILCLAKMRRYSIKEVPIRWRDDADSRLDLIAGNIRNVRDIFRIRMQTEKVPPMRKEARELVTESRG